MTVEVLVVFTAVLTVLGTAVTGWLVSVSYRAYRRRGTRMLAFATAGLGLIAISRVFGFGSSWSYLAQDHLTVSFILVVQVARSMMLTLGFALIIYALFTHS